MQHQGDIKATPSHGGGEKPRGKKSAADLTKEILESEEEKRKSLEAKRVEEESAKKSEESRKTQEESRKAAKKRAQKVERNDRKKATRPDEITEVSPEGLTEEL